MHENGNQSDFQTILDQAKVLFERKREEVEVLAVALRVKQAELRQIQAMLRAGGMVEEKKESPKKKAERGVREDTMQNVLRAIRNIETPALDDVPFSFTAAMMVEATGHSGSVTRRVIEILREQGVIRLAGTKQGDVGKAAQVYAPVNP